MLGFLLIRIFHFYLFFPFHGINHPAASGGEYNPQRLNHKFLTTKSYADQYKYGQALSPVHEELQFYIFPFPNA
jgi:hypothetical protein